MRTLTPALVGAQCNCLALRRAARGIARRYDDALRPLDLNNGQFSMLCAIAAMQPAAMHVIGKRLGMDRTTVTAALKPLLRRDLVTVEVPDEDQRGRAVSLTRAGATLLRRAMPFWQAAQEDVARLLGGPDHSATLRRQLAALD
jgi:DNA-binding MarR family transcriptional regulator